MNVLVVGSGGREHAIVKALGRSQKVKKVFSHPGSSAMFMESEKLSSRSLISENYENLLKEVVAQQIELVVVGPEAPLVEGLSDFLRENGILVFGPDQEGAKLEGDKLFAKDFMEDFGIPTGGYHKISNTKTLEEGLGLYEDKPFYVFKYRDLAGGKGVLVSKSKEEIRKFAKNFEVSDKQTSVVAYLEEPLVGWELSCICLVSEEGYSICPILQDHKRLLDNDKGPNTGGMGVAGPLKVEPSLMKEIEEKIILPTLKGIEERGILYRGALYFGVMVTVDGPKVLEYNVRFGDPEAQLIFSLVESDWGEHFYKVALGKKTTLKQSADFAACVVLASQGYPEKPTKGDEIKGLESLDKDVICHAGTLLKEGSWRTNGGRVLGVIGRGSDLKTALKSVYKDVDKVSFKGMQFRKDIGQKLL